MACSPSHSSSLGEEDSVVVLVLIDLSSAFDKIDHAFLLPCLLDMYGIYDEALAWIGNNGVMEFLNLK